MHRLQLILLMTAVLAGPASAVPLAIEPRYEDYVVARVALNERNLEVASERYATALAADPDSGPLKRRAFEVALAAGDYDQARRLAKLIDADEASGGSIALLLLSDAIRSRKWDAASAAADRLGDAGFAGLVGPIARAWIAYGRGDRKGAVDLLALPQRSDPVLRSYVAEHRARMLEGAGDKAAGTDAWKAFAAGAGTGAPSSGLRLRAAAALQRAGDREGAGAVLAPAEGALADAAKARLAAGEPLARGPDGPREGMGALYARLAADLAQRGALPAAIQLARLSVLMTPNVDNQRLLLGELLGLDRQPAAGLEVIRTVSRRSLYASDALGLRARLLNEAGREDEALALVTKAAAAKGATANDWARLGEFHRAKDRHLEAAAAYGRAIELMPPSTPGRWTLFFLRGGAYEQAGDWAKAEPDLREAYRMAPEEAVVLNYLGYGLLDRGESLEEAEALIRKAADKAPNNAAIIDSLGWAYFRTGRFDKAVEALERAVAGEPGDPTINEHLGDAYWAVGRRVEARFRWRAAADADPDATARERLAAKLDWGMDKAALASAPVPVLAPGTPAANAPPAPPK